ncbi:enoyl-CoA hydratase/isomerase family protein [Bosea sp. (in: a-proteobacteria)]|uniref:enoyl-CoA hydratase/isomerase family protein n=1 Tax=Bosea sp. (in: a-proteobacteria) TaxID=1871050 RepID=UPI00263837A3|nr:enoyl-CoA hydratase/isomerase family protein [Bosea sp. (in: a-proteobacteria)]MCO5092836.1 enoyl-CoA hydratase/isomerase family protein [Bosea sp. (in: a-proteobacteria)]
MTQQREITCEIRGAAGLVILDRPSALNALSLGMVRALASALDAWEDYPQVTRVVVVSTSGKAFCAGGDIRWLHDRGKAGRHDEMLAFWAEEYALNHRIKTYPKPYVALIDGIVMGGGVGISLHGSHRIAGDRYLFAMPEVGIGFFPDVGATWALPRLDGGFGGFLALTGERIGAADALSAGLATHAVPSERMAELTDALTRPGAIDDILAGFTLQRGPGPLHGEQAMMADVFGAATLPEVIERLRRAEGKGSAFAGKLTQTIAVKSPTSVAIAFAQMRLGGGLDFAEAMRTEYRIVSRIARGHDFYEGVRAVVIDKDQAPRWRPATLEEVDQADIDAYFAPLGADELKLEG